MVVATAKVMVGGTATTADIGHSVLPGAQVADGFDYPSTAAPTPQALIFKAFFPCPTP